MRRIFLHQLDKLACSYYRAQLPYEKCKDYCATKGVELVLSSTLDTRDEYDVYLFHRVFQPTFKPFVERLKAAGKEIWWETDDDIWHIPEWNPASAHIREAEREMCDWACEIADKIIVSTQALHDVIGRPEKTLVCPNLIDPGAWPAVQPRDGITRVLWAGSVHHSGDLEEFVEPLQQLMLEYPAVEWYFFGDLPETFVEYVRIKNSNLAMMAPSRKYQNLRFVPPVPFSDYAATLCTLRPDIGLAPLQDHPFNLSKSNIKYLEYTLAGAACVCSDFGPYRTSLGFTVAKKADPYRQNDCYHSIKRLIDDPELRQGLRDRSLHQVHKYHSWRPDTLTAWYKLFTGEI